MRKRIAIVVLWLLLGLPGTGMCLAEFDTKFPGNCRRQAAFSYGFALFGPIGSAVVVIATGFGEHGVRFTCKGK